MDEAEKYQQRLQAIAEKRRLQEEQERARRDMEDERLRLQQLKRKSLRDQWLMEAPPLSPSSMDTQSPRSPLWGSQAQEIEQRIDQLQTESQRLAEEEEKLTEQMEDGQTDGPAVAESGADSAPGPVVENGQAQDQAESVEAEEEVDESQSPLSEDAAALTNGRGEGEGEAAPQDAPSGEDGRPGTNGAAVVFVDAIDTADGPVTLTFLGFSEAEPGRLPVNGEEGVGEEMEEEEEGAVVMRAERVIIMDEGEEAAADEPLAQGESGEVGEAGTPQPRCPSPDGEEEEAEAAEPEAVPEASTGPDEEEEAEKEGKEEEEKEEEKEGAAMEADPATGEAEGEGGAGGEGEGGTEEVAPETEVRAATPDPQSPAAAEALDGAVAAVPVYSEAPPALAPGPDADGEAARPVAAESQGDPGSKAAPEAKAEAPLPGQEFQEVSLAEPRTEAASAEQEPLLSPSKAPQTQAGAQAEAAAPPETLAPARGQGGDAPKRKTCQCCSVM